MSEEIKMPQMGESITEGTIVRWLKQVGDPVKRDEPLFEISTDKVDAEIPAPASGVLTEIKVKEGETVAINTVVAVIDGGGARPAATISQAEPAPASAPVAPQPPRTPAPPAAPPQAPEVTASVGTAATAGASRTAPHVTEHVRSSPLVRNIAAEHGIDISQIEGTGVGGRVSKNDILSFIENQGAAKASAKAVAPSIPEPAAAAPPQPPAPAEVSVALRKPTPTVAASTASVVTPQKVYTAGEAGPAPFSEGDRYEIEPMSMMRKRIAERMVESKHTSAHVTTFMEIDFTKTAKLRDSLKQEYLERDGVRLSFMPFIVKGVIEGIKKWPIVNSSIWGDQIVYKTDINIGIAVALDWGLIVPVIRNADERSLLGLARAVNDLGDRARSKQLKPDDVQGGTFTITNPGGFGSLVGTPIINQPQVAILGVGVIKKRPVVIDDAIAIRQIGYFGLSFDHRVIDGAVADQFLAVVRGLIENANYTS